MARQGKADARPVHHQTRLMTVAGRRRAFGDAAVHGEMGQLKAEHTVVGAQDEQAQLLGKAEGDPLVAAATQGGR
jgi:hypothetical protein